MAGGASVVVDRYHSGQHSLQKRPCLIGPEQAIMVSKVIFRKDRQSFQSRIHFH